MTDKRRPECLIVTGMPGAGKSTVTRLIASALPRAAHVKGDDVHYMILSGRLRFDEEPAEEADRQGELCDRNLCALAANFVDYGFTAVVDEVVSSRAELDFQLRLLSPRPVQFVVLAPGADVCRHRNETRDPEESWVFDGYTDLDRRMRRELGDVGWWLDTSGLTAEETADLIIRERHLRAAVA